MYRPIPGPYPSLLVRCFSASLLCLWDWDLWTNIHLSSTCYHKMISTYISTSAQDTRWYMYRPNIHQVSSKWAQPIPKNITCGRCISTWNFPGRRATMRLGMATWLVEYRPEPMARSKSRYLSMLPDVARLTSTSSTGVCKNPWICVEKHRVGSLTSKSGPAGFKWCRASKQWHPGEHLQTGRTIGHPQTQKKIMGS